MWRHKPFAVAFAWTAALVLAPFAVLAQSDYPSRPIRVVVPFPPGGVVDTIGRLWAQKVGPSLGTIVVEGIPVIFEGSDEVKLFASGAGMRGSPRTGVYAAAKAGMIGFSKSLAKEVASRNITVNTVAPGFIETDMTANVPESVRDDARALTPLRRLGQPEEVAAAVRFLVSDAAFV